jgi:hypothetical protein
MQFLQEHLKSPAGKQHQVLHAACIHISSSVSLIQAVHYFDHAGSIHAAASLHPLQPQHTRHSSQLKIWSTPYNRSYVTLGDAQVMQRTLHGTHMYGETVHSLCSVPSHINAVIMQFKQSYSRGHRKQHFNTAPSAALQLQPAPQQSMPLHSHPLGSMPP